MKLIPLTQGKFAQVDDADYDYLMQWKWHFDNRYAKRVEWLNKEGRGRKGKVIYMHRQIMATPQGFETDHIDGDGINNQKINLRNCTHCQNGKNMRISKNKKSSKFKGVFANSSGGFFSSIYVDKKLKSLGTFKTEVEAALAYNSAALKYYGEFSHLNVIP